MFFRVMSVVPVVEKWGLVVVCECRSVDINKWI